MSILVNEDDKSGCTLKTFKTSSKQKSAVTEGCRKWLEGNNSQSSFIFFPVDVRLVLMYVSITSLDIFRILCACAA